MRVSALQNYHHHNHTFKIIYSLMSQLSTDFFPTLNISTRSFEFMIYNHQQPWIFKNMLLISLFPIWFFGESIPFPKFYAPQGLDRSQCSLPFSFLLQNCFWTVFSSASLKPIPSHLITCYSLWSLSPSNTLTLWLLLPINWWL